MKVESYLALWGLKIDSIAYNGEINQERKTAMAETPKYIRNTGDPWTAADEKELRELADQNTPTRVIGLKLGRTEDAIRAKAAELGISLKPTNQSPYNRQD
jgi:hypothetical protein